MQAAPHSVLPDKIGLDQFGVACFPSYKFDLSL